MLAVVLFGNLLAITFPAPIIIPPINPEWTNKFLRGVSVPEGISIAVDQDYRACNLASNWAFTFDDGTSNHTLVVLDALKQKNIKATFFVIGSSYLADGRNRDILRRTFEEGHEIALHTWSHTDLITLTNDQIVAEIVYNSEIIREIIGVSPKIFRAPFGSINQRVRAILRAMRLEKSFIGLLILMIGELIFQIWDLLLREYMKYLLTLRGVLLEELYHCSMIDSKRLQI
jgi:peptidoglycan/xylan/chitin deacetylase (PgdA/CDA1 family)